MVCADEGIRETSAERLAGLAAAFRSDGTHTAASSSQISDGAAAVVVMSRRVAADMELRPLARIAGQSFVGVDPVLRLTGPIPATRALFASLGMSADDVDLYEVNEAFASVVLASAARDRGGSGPRQRQRWRDRARAPRRRNRRATGRDGVARDDPPGRGDSDGHDVLRYRPRHRDRSREGVMKDDTSVGGLGANDQEEYRRALWRTLEQADLRILLMVVFQLSGDTTWLEPPFEPAATCA